MHAPLLLLGDEAVALGAVHAGISAAYGYPGTPSTEILEVLLRQAKESRSPHVSWTTNEKTALEQGLGTSVVGRRSLVTMKHVGLNVAADPFMSSALVSIHGGLVLVVADDPGMHSSQNEQDSRYFADFAGVPCLEPADAQQAYDMTREAFEISERFHQPVLIRIVTRVAHGKGLVKTAEALPEKPLQKAPAAAPWILIPSNARKQWGERLKNRPELRALMESHPVNELKLENTNRELGVITTGLALAYYRECQSELKRPVSHLHIGAYPFPEQKIRDLAATVKTLIVLEEGYPFVERFLRGVIPPNIEIVGKMSGSIPAQGELTPEIVRKTLGIPSMQGQKLPGGLKLPGRPPQLCPGCPHTDSFHSIKAALASFQPHLVTSDIGCYALGAMPEYNAIETCVCMGASIGMAKGAADAGLHPVVAVLGDSTFLHSGMTALLDAVASNTNMTVMILDNETVAMTGGQTTIVPSPRLKDVVLGLGVSPEHLHVVTTHRKFIEENAKLIRQEVEHPGISVIIAVRECVETAKKKKT
ncbi:MAG: indolepyruvate ferredoxin oxidoreductase [Bdellovibrionales bacterium GWB1_55_8]|nr:MAG: indolepyruvate ferredoxin oxidoreductase [Bdellovibrionales bacterium GWB1_55_8]